MPRKLKVTFYRQTIVVLASSIAVVPVNSNVRPYVSSPPLRSLLTTSFQTFVSPDSSGSSGRKMIVYRANVGIAARSCTIYRSSLPFIEMCVPVREGALLSVAVDFYHRFRPP